jgi:Epoxide hydrolase N terminus
VVAWFAPYARCRYLSSRGIGQKSRPLNTARPGRSPLALAAVDSRAALACSAANSGEPANEQASSLSAAIRTAAHQTNVPTEGRPTWLSPPRGQRTPRRSSRSRSSFPRGTLRICLRASPRPVSLRGSRSRIASCIRWETPPRRRASSWRRWKHWRYWGTEYDLRRIEARLNALPQFLTEIDGLDIHFIHVKSRHENALPVILIHGWPGSVVEMLSVVGPLTDPTAHGGSAEDAFDVVIPSIPGYGFSGKPTRSGWGPERVASALAELMRRLGYKRLHALRMIAAGIFDQLPNLQIILGHMGE